ncbi:MAG TPA: quinoprotein dehydrogenase-associated SoxYZ-like carrier [Candidatus Sulfotelmatobacter sp.]|jgi:sulfur-oxidizing protein SoxY|nr:quinoprotein dehydrogenase-associated SoxYZ-like carrier [Candidatus Sulfotelmatobacter sp.]
MRGGIPQILLSAALLGGLAVLPVAAAAQPPSPEADPFESVNWDGVRDAVFGQAPLRFDLKHVQVEAPRKVEDGGQVPVAVSVQGLGKIREIVLVADLNPAPRAYSFRPIAAQPRLATRIKVDQATALHAAALTEDGVWHVGGTKVDAPGGGCTTPSATQSSQSWKTHLNAVQGKAWRRADGGDRLRIRVIHPMNTGFVAGIPAFFIDHMQVRTAEGKLVAELLPAEPLAENPVITLDLTPEGTSASGYRLDWSDTDGNRGSAPIPAASQSLAAEEP